MTEEKLLFKGSSSPLIQSGTFFFCVLILAASITFALLQTPWLWILAGVVAVFMLIQWALIKTRVYEATTERLRVRTGLLTRRTDEMELYRVQDLTLIEPFFARMFGLGTIVVTTNDTSTPTIRMEYIRNASGLREELRKSVETCRDRKNVRVTEFE